MKVNGNKEKGGKKNLRKTIDVQLLTSKMKRSKNQRSFKPAWDLKKKKIYFSGILNRKNSRSRNLDVEGS